ncbi:head-tail connector protein [Xenorhabdus bovienii]|uniref:head-tail connector protein n=1 Tax=Xenorhabdus bovienii TaxID=40576 RepID=UPI0023B2C419|nr:head-tail connector protein [Xenorhabdus bovienii]
MRAGRLRHRITLQKNKSTRDKFGGVINNWEDVAEAALEVCQQHIGKRFDDGLSFTPAIKVGCLLYIGLLYENREMATDVELKEVPFTIKSLWSVYRDVGVY